MTVTRVGPERAAWMAAVHAESFDAPWDAPAFESFLARPGMRALAEGWDGFVLTQAVVDEAEVLTLAVRADARRRGVARALLQAAAAELTAAGVATLRLEVAEDNAAALALYAANGFETEGRRPRYYARPGGARVDARLMMRRLTGLGVAPTLPA